MVRKGSQMLETLLPASYLNRLRTDLVRAQARGGRLQDLLFVAALLGKRDQ